METHTEILTKMINDHPVLQSLFASTQPSYRYFSKRGKDQDRYFWTTEKVNHKGKPRYIAGIYRYIKSRKAFKLVKEVGCIKRTSAKEKAYDWYKREL
jgi:hypothetical protein